MITDLASRYFPLTLDDILMYGAVINFLSISSFYFFSIFLYCIS